MMTNTNPSEKLWKFLKDKKLYSKDYSQFQNQFNTPEKQDKLHGFMTSKKVYSKTADDFKSQFFNTPKTTEVPNAKPQRKQPEAVKKNEALSYEEQQELLASVYENKLSESIANDELIKGKSDSIKAVYSGQFQQEIDSISKNANSEAYERYQEVLGERSRELDELFESGKIDAQTYNIKSSEANRDAFLEYKNTPDIKDNEAIKEIEERYGKKINEDINNNPDVIKRIQELSSKNYAEAQKDFAALQAIESQKKEFENENIQEATDEVASKIFPGGKYGFRLFNAGKTKAKYGLPQMRDQINLMQTSQNINEAKGIIENLKSVADDTQIKDPFYQGFGQHGATRSAKEVREEAEERLSKSIGGMSEYITSIKSLEEKISAQGVKSDLLEVESIDDFLTTAVGIVGEQSIIMPLALIGGGLAMETAEAYYSQVSAIAEAQGKTIKEVIEQGLDDPDAALFTGSIAGSLEVLGTGKVVSALSRAVKGSVRKAAIEWTGTTATEFGTEFAQNLTIQLQNKLIAGKEINFREAVSEGLAGLLMGGLLGSSVFIRPQQKEAIAKNFVEKEMSAPEVDLEADLKNNETTIDEQRQEPTTSRTEEEIDNDGQPNIEEREGNTKPEAPEPTTDSTDEAARKESRDISQPVREPESKQPIDEGSVDLTETEQAGKVNKPTVDEVKQKLIEQDNIAQLKGARGLAVYGKELDKAWEDLKQGKKTKRAEKLEKVIEQAVEEGGISLNMGGTGANAEYIDISLDEWLGLNEPVENVNFEEGKIQETLNFFSENGEVDYNKVAQEIEDSPEQFTSFVFELSQEEFAELKNIVDEKRNESKGNEGQTSLPQTEATSGRSEAESKGSSKEITLSSTEDITSSVPTNIKPTEAKIKQAKKSLSNNLAKLNEKLKNQRGNLSMNPFADPELAKIVGDIAKDLVNLGYLKAKEFTAAISKAVGETISDADARKLLKQARIDLEIDETPSLNDRASDRASSDIPVIDDTPTGKKKKERSASKTIREFFSAAEKEKATSKVLNRKKPTYRTVSTEEAIGEAKKYVEENGGFENILHELTSPSTVKELPVKQVLRQMAIEYYGELVRQAKGNKEVQENGFDALESIINSLRDEMAKEATFAGRANAFTNPMTVLGGKLGVEFHNYVVRKRNNKRKAELKGKQKAELEHIEKTSKDVVGEINEGSKKAVEKTVISKAVKQAVRNVAGKHGKNLEKQRASIKKRRAAAIDKFKNASKNGLNSTIIGFTSEQVEALTEIAATYVEEGIVNLKELGNKLREVAGEKLSQKDAETIAAAAKTEIAEEIKKNPKAIIKDLKKSLSINIQELIRSHYTDQRKAGKALARKLVEELGLEGKDADSLARVVEKEFQKHLEPYKQKALEKSLFPSEKVTNRKRKNFFEKMEEMIRLGALTDKRYKEAFAEKFGLEKEIPDDSVIIIQDLIHLVNTLPERSSIQTKAKLMLMDEFAKYSSKDGWFESMLDLAYANSLSGIMTFYVNAKANFQNFSELGLEAVSFTDWMRDFTSAVKDKSLQKFLNDNPFARMTYTMVALTRGVKNGFNLFLATMQTGGIDNKYFESLNDPTRYRKSNFEKPSEVRRGVFKPLKIKGVDTNPINLVGKWVRNLVAVDLFFRATATQVELMRSLHQKHINTGLSGGKLWAAVMDDFYVRNEDKMDIAEKRSEEQIREFESLTGIKLTPSERRVVIEESFNKETGLSEEAIEDVDTLARDYNFTRPRNGSVSKITKAFTNLIHRNKATKMVLLPFMPFSTILGRIGDRAIDFAPLYGFLRAYGYGFGTALPKRIAMFNNKEADFLTAFSPNTYIDESSQMGERGSRSQQAQLRKASIGMVVSIAASALFLGSDEDDYLFISGSYAAYGDFDKRTNRDKVFPKYTIKVGNKRFNYLNSPIALPLLYIGNLNDMMRSGKHQEEEIWNTAFFASNYVAESFKDISVFGSINDIIDAFSALTEVALDSKQTLESKGKTISRETLKPILGFYSNALPQNNNMVKQVHKFFNPASFNQKTIKEYMAYNSGVYMFFDNKLGLVPRYDLFGDPIKTYPGQNMISAEWFRDSKANDPRWRFLVDNNVIPTQAGDAQPKDKDMLHLEDVPQKYQYEYKKRAGELFSGYIEKEIKRFNATPEKLRQSKYFKEFVFQGKKTTILKRNINALFSAAKAKARAEINKKYGYY